MQEEIFDHHYQHNPNQGKEACKRAISLVLRKDANDIEALGLMLENTFDDIIQVFQTVNANTDVAIDQTTRKMLICISKFLCIMFRLNDVNYEYNVTEISFLNGYLDIDEISDQYIQHEIITNFRNVLDKVNYESISLTEKQVQYIDQYQVMSSNYENLLHFIENNQFPIN